MGQQQLLLIVLGVIVVGIAVVLGIQYFSVGAEKAAKDELVAHCQMIAADAQEWYKKPVTMGGGGGTFLATNGAVADWDIPAKLQTTSSAGQASVNQSTGVITVSEAGYIAEVGDQTVTITATPNNPDYAWTVICTVWPENSSCVITPN